MGARAASGVAGPRPLVCGLLALALTAALTPFAPTAVAADCPSATRDAATDRLAGSNRWATAACASIARYPAGASTALLARGDTAGRWADALAGAVLARAVDGPVLMTHPSILPEATRAELQRLRPATVLVLGGPGAVGTPVLDAVRAALPSATIERVEGGDRNETAVAVSDRAGAGGTAFVVNGRRPADALVAAAPAARTGAKLLLTEGDALPPATRAALAGLRQVTIVGGYGVVSQAVENAIAAVVGAGAVRRVSGGDRYETAASTARRFPAAGRMFLTNGADRSLVDAIAAGWSAAAPGGGVVLYVERDAPGRGADRYLRPGGLRADQAIRLVGGVGALSERLVDALLARRAEARAGGPRAQVRGVWIHLFDGTLKSGPTIDAMLDRVAAANLNTVIVEVVRRQDAYYPSTVLPQTPDPGRTPGLDVVARVLSAARDRGFAVHAWAPALPAYHGAYAGLRLPLWEQHGAGSADPWVSVTHGGAQGTFFDPGVPAVADHVVAVFRELAQRYPDLDAVHLDYLRYESQEWGYHPTSLERFRTAYGLPAGFRPAVDDWRFDAWRREQTRAIAERVRAAVRAVSAKTAVTMAGSTIGAPPRTTTDYSNTQTWHDVFQAWPQWLAAGHLDAVFPMNYFRESTHASWYDGWVAFERRLDDDCDGSRPPCVLAVGQAGFLNPVAGSLAQIAQALADTDGAVVFSGQQTTESGDPFALFGALPGGLFRDPAPAPRLR